MDAALIDTTVDVSPYTLFMVDNVVYGISSKFVLSIEICGKPTPLVNAPYYTLGILDFRGNVIPLVSLRRLFGLGLREPEFDSTGTQMDEAREMLLVLDVNGVEKGMVVDEIVSVEYITKFIDMPSNAAKSRYVRSLAKRGKDNSSVLLIDEELIIGL